MSYLDDPHVQWMLDFQRGDEDAFVRLVEAYSNGIIALIQRMTGNRATAEDLAQEVFIRIHRSKNTYTPKSKFSTWIFRIAANLSLNEIRDRSRYRPGQLPETFQPPGAEDNPGSRMDQARLQKVIWEALMELPENQRVAVILARYHDHTYAEIAATLGTTTQAVKSLLNRAKMTLQKKLGPLQE